MPVRCAAKETAVEGTSISDARMSPAQAEFFDKPQG
jgi:hypothetical protein